jgi:hypothetical protein
MPSPTDCVLCQHAKTDHFGEKGRCALCWAVVGATKCLRYRAPKGSKPSKPRSRIKPVSDHRAEINVIRKANLEEAWGPQRFWECAVAKRFGTKWGSASGRVGEDAGGVPIRVRIPRCIGPVAAHEVLSRSRAGRTDENITNVDGMLPMCSGHNGWIEDQPNLAKLLGYARSYSKG